MAEEIKAESCCTPDGESGSTCKIESLISVDERGQMVLPKEIREKANINPGDKLAVITWERDEKVCCINLIKVEELTQMVKGILKPIMNEVL